MSWMFYGCSNLTSLNLSSFNTFNVRYMISMFSKCKNLKSIEFGNLFKTNNVSDMNSLFSECSSLESLNLSFFNISNVNDINNMFYNCFSLNSVIYHHLIFAR